MPRPRLLMLLAFGATLLIGCREGLDFDRAFTADEERGKALIRQNCANSCHPSDAFTKPVPQRKVKNFNQLAYAVRDYYEQVVGDEQNYSQQDVFDMARYLNKQYYHYRSFLAMSEPKQPQGPGILDIAMMAMLVFIPIAVAAEYLHWGAGIVFVTSMLGIVPLAKGMGNATEEIALRVGPGLGGLLNATFGNATELIIALFALHAGLYEVVQASITGSIIGNILFVLGAAIFLGGMKYPHQYFNRTIAGLNTSLLVLAVVGLLVPAGFAATTSTMPAGLMQKFSIFVAVILIVVYVCNLVFALKTHTDLYAGGESQHEEEEEPTMSMGKAIGLLLGTTLLVSWMSELLVGSIEHVTHDWGMSKAFIGVILVPIVGNAAEHLTAVTVALKNKMDLSLGIAIGSATQIALLVAPALVLAGAMMGRPLTLAFSPFEVLSVVMAVVIANFITLDGESNWLEGTMLLATYGILAVAFFLHP